MKTNPFYCHSTHGFLRVAVTSPKVHLGHPMANVSEICRVAKQAHAHGVSFLVTPELSLSGYSLDDVLRQEIILSASLQALEVLMKETSDLAMVVAVGMPLAHKSEMYNTAAIIAGGRCLGFVPKRYLPSYREYYEGRIFASGADVKTSVRICGQNVPLADRLLVSFADCRIGIEICEDAWVPATPGMRDALAGAEVIANLSASNAEINKAPIRDDLVRQRSYTGRCAYLYVAAGYGESTTDLAWDGQGLIYELGEKLEELPRYTRKSVWRMADIDIEHIRRERRLHNVFHQNARHVQALSPTDSYCECQAEIITKPCQGELHRPMTRMPYVPDQKDERDRLCEEVYHIQVQGLLRRLESVGAKTLVLGLSGGIDSGHALLIAHAVFQELGKPLEDLMVWYLEGPASKKASFQRAKALCDALGIQCRRISICASVRQMLRDLGHPAARDNPGQDVYDTTYENIQAGLRSDYLFRLANQHDGFVVGTGDLSELAMGWCTYGIGDHMAHYNVNASLAKTLIQYVMRWLAEKQDTTPATCKAIESILAAGISPELIPNVEQLSEDILGSYELNDFFLYHTLSNGFGPEKVAFLAYQNWMLKEPLNQLDMATILDRLSFFYQRFFLNQYKRSTMPNAPKTAAGDSLSPRGDWRAPSDLAPDLWLARVEELKQNLQAS